MPHPRPRTQISNLAKVGGAGCGRAAASDLKWQVGQVGTGGEVCTCVGMGAGRLGPALMCYAHRPSQDEEPG